MRILLSMEEDANGSLLGKLLKVILHIELSLTLLEKTKIKIVRHIMKILKMKKITTGRRVRLKKIN